MNSIGKRNKVFNCVYSVIEVNTSATYFVAPNTFLRVAGDVVRLDLSVQSS